MSIAAPPKSSCSTTHFRYEKGFFYKIRCGVLEQQACINLGAPNDCFLWNICSERQKLPRIFYSLRKAENLYMTVPFMYNFQSLSNKIPMRLSQDGFWWFHLLFRSGFVCSVLFSRLNSQWAKKKMYSSKGIISLWSALSFFLRYKLNLVVTALQLSHDSFGTNWICPYSASRFRKTAAGRIIFSSN